MSTGGVSKLIERPKGGQTSVLVHLEFPKSDHAAEQAEFIDLVRSAGAEVLTVIGGRRDKPDSRFYAGAGKVDEIANAVIRSGANLVIFNHDLSPSQERNLEQRLSCRVVDRTGLILDIFAQRARTFEGKLQVELAQLEHLSTRLVRGWTHLERQSGGIGTRGPGESQLETDRRLVREKIGTLRRRLEEVRSRRARSRRARARGRVPSISLVGYTNAGKSTLFNALTGNDSYASSQLFATLDTTARQLSLPSGSHVIVADTVGFIRDLPHGLVASFRATLEEAREADLLLHVIDASDPERLERIQQVQSVLSEIGASEVPTMEVFNKIDLRSDEVPRVEPNTLEVPSRVFVSARTGAGIDELKEAISVTINNDMVERCLELPASAARLRAKLFALKAVQDEDVTGNGNLVLRVRLSEKQLVDLCREEGVRLPTESCREENTLML